MSGSSAINALGETVFILTVAASFLISFDSYINAMARKPTLYAILTRATTRGAAAVIASSRAAPAAGTAAAALLLAKTAAAATASCTRSSRRSGSNT